MSYVKPLSVRLRPKTIDEFVGQKHLLTNESALYKIVKTKKLCSMLFVGPPGTGKTTLAEIIASNCNAEIFKLNATTCGVKEVRDVIALGKSNSDFYNKSTVLFLDEIHRFSKNQQDALLDAVENNFLTLLCSTTENPHFSVNPALISRMIIFQIKSLEIEDFHQIKIRVIEYYKKEFLKNVEISDEAFNFLIKSSSGDCRIFLNILENIIEIETEENINVTVEMIKSLLPNKIAVFNKKGDEHYNYISAFIKSIRGSDPDAAVYWLAVLLNCGEDPKFIARRLVISASEDIGMANSNALNIATSCMNAIMFVGMPEARIILSHATIYLATSPKSNSAYAAINKAMKFTENESSYVVPEYLKDGHTSFKDRSQEYKYPHDYPDSYVKQKYFHENSKFYQPKLNKYEKAVKAFMDKIKK